MEQTIKIKIIIGSTREGRFSEKPAHWIYGEAKETPGIEAELLDLRDYQMPFYDEPVSPSRVKDGNYPKEIVRKWAEKIKEADGYIIVTPEYNHGYPAVLKNALDNIYHEWGKKPVGFVSYGGVGGARSVEQLRQVAVELAMAPIRTSVHIPSEIYRAVVNEKSPVNPELFQPLKERAGNFIGELMWWAKALKAAR